MRGGPDLNRSRYVVFVDKREPDVVRDMDEFTLGEEREARQGVRVFPAGEHADTAEFRIVNSHAAAVSAGATRVECLDTRRVEVDHVLLQRFRRSRQFGGSLPFHP